MYQFDPLSTRNRENLAWKRLSRKTGLRFASFVFRCELLPKIKKNKTGVLKSFIFSGSLLSFLTSEEGNYKKFLSHTGKFLRGIIVQLKFSSATIFSRFIRLMYWLQQIKN